MSSIVNLKKRVIEFLQPFSSSHSSPSLSPIHIYTTIEGSKLVWHAQHFLVVSHYGLGGDIEGCSIGSSRFLSQVGHLLLTLASRVRKAELQQSKWLAQETVI